jgi:hypothetical protein
MQREAGIEKHGAWVVGIEVIILAISSKNSLPSLRVGLNLIILPFLYMYGLEWNQSTLRPLIEDTEDAGSATYRKQKLKAVILGVWMLFSA